jgi:hypothetical protein
MPRIARVLGRLSRDEEVVLAAITRAANAGYPCPTADDLLDLLPQFHSVSVTVDIVNRLEAEGMIEVERYQRGRRVKIVSTGNMTALPTNLAPHWRTRPGNVLTPALHVLRARNFDLTREIMNAARQEGKDLSWFLGDLVFEAMRARAIHADSDAA